MYANSQHRLVPPGVSTYKIKSGPGFRLGCFGGEETQFRRASIGKSLISDGWNVKRVIILRGSGLFKLRSAQVFAHFKVGIVIAEG